MGRARHETDAREYAGELRQLDKALRQKKATGHIGPGICDPVTVHAAAYSFDYKGRPKDSVMDDVVSAMVLAAKPTVMRNGGQSEFKRFSKAVKGTGDKDAFFSTSGGAGSSGSYFNELLMAGCGWSCFRIGGDDSFLGGQKMAGVCVTGEWTGPQGRPARVMFWAMALAFKGTMQVRTRTQVCLPSGMPPDDISPYVQDGPGQRLWDQLRSQGVEPTPTIEMSAIGHDGDHLGGRSDWERALSGAALVIDDVASEGERLSKGRVVQEPGAIEGDRLGGNDMATLHATFMRSMIDPSISYGQTASYVRMVEYADYRVSKNDEEWSDRVDELKATHEAETSAAASLAKASSYREGERRGEKKALERARKSAKKEFQDKVAALERELGESARKVSEAESLREQAGRAVEEAERKASEADKRAKDAEELERSVEARERSLKEDLELMDMELSDRDNEIRRLKAKVAELEREAEDVVSYADGLSTMPVSAMAHVPRTLGDLVDLAEVAWPERLVFLSSAHESADEFEGRDLDRYWKAISALAEVLWPLHFVTKGTDERSDFEEQSGVEYSCHESDSVRNKSRWRTLRTFRYKGGDLFMERHLKMATQGGATCRLYFEFDEDDRTIVVGHVGRHPKNDMS